MKAVRVATDVFRMRTLMVNVYFVRDRASGEWALIDTGLPGFARPIQREAERLFGTRPRRKPDLQDPERQDEIRAQPARKAAVDGSAVNMIIVE